MEKWQLDLEVAKFLGVSSPVMFLEELMVASPYLQGAAMSLLGPAGTGKTAIVKKTARRLRKKTQKIKIVTVEPEDICGIPTFSPPLENRLAVLQTPKGVKSWLSPRRGSARGLQRQGGRTPRPTRNTRSKTWTRT